MTSAREESPAETGAKASKDEAILVLLAQLAIVYWRPDFTPGQARQLYTQYLDDLREYALKDIADAIKEYRRDPESKFYPAPGQLRGMIERSPSWNVISKKNWIAERRQAAREEMAMMITHVEESKALLMAPR